MAISFPTSPTTGQTYTYNNRTWQWNGTAWQIFKPNLSYVDIVTALGFHPFQHEAFNSDDIYVRGTAIATDFNSLSDERLKDNIQTIVDPVNKVTELRGVSFNWKKDGKPAIGVVAQELEQVFPELVSEYNGNKIVNYDGLIGVLIEAIKELKKEVEILKTEKTK